MKKGIHPECKMVTAKCSCGNSIQICTTVNGDLNIDVCSKCHPFYTGKQRTIAVGSRINRFNKRFNVKLTNDY